ncbi:hypothetical protein BD310DRAFT_977001 [Dichomitus squalens]|uniref:Fungal-type protein kinase domain-containing protein n=1 Tax=Dichomitus squalens TaxID=114155 RepID=A0A4V2K878_9APHY|nr:hypothetical protein BD310DRAFT_977001 [Dichomitus squalens]
MEPQVFPSSSKDKPHSSPVQFAQDKHHDWNREPGIVQLPNAPFDRLEMVRDLHGKVVWLSLKDFVNKLLPIPRRLLFNKFPPEQMSKINAALEGVIQNYKQRAQENKCLPEDQLATDFTDVINRDVLAHSAGDISNMDQTSVTVPIIPADSSTHLASDADEALESTTRSSHPIQHTDTIDTVPHYVVRLSPHKWDLSDPARNKSDAALFMKDVELEEGRPNWQHQRAFFEFKQEGTQNDPFEDAQKRDVEVLADKRQKVRGQLISYADRVFLYQHRTAAFSLFVIGKEFRVMRWDRSGVFVSEKVDYLLRTDALVEVLLALIVMDDEAQGFDTSATLLQKDSDDYRLMDTLADVNISFHLPVVSSEEGTPLPKNLASVPSQPLPTNTNTVMNDPSPGLAAQAEDSDSEETVTLKIPNSDSFVFDYVLDYFRKSVTDWPRYNLTINDEEFLVGKPLYHTRGLVGRGTRGYVAYRKRTRTFVFLKDAWRPFYENVVSEGEILDKLNKDGVCNIPTLLTAQLFDHETRVSRYCYKEDLRTNEERKMQAHEGPSDGPHGVKRTQSGMQEELKSYVRHYGHHRLALKEVCLPITAFRSSRQLVSVVGDAVEAHYEATTKSMMIHRDISSGNILILPKFVIPDDGDGNTTLRIRWRGILADWELSKPLQDVGARQPERTGTWRYMSVASLLDAFHIVGTADEIESFFNVVLHNAIRYCSHNVELYVSSFIDNYFVRFEQLPDGTIQCPGAKVNAIKNTGEIRVSNNTRVEFGVNGRPNKALNDLITTLLRWFKARYDVEEYEDSLRSQETSTSATDAASESRPPPAQRQRVDSSASKTGSPFQGTTFREDSAVSGLVKPSTETYKRAARLHDHHAVRGLFWEILHSEDETDWPQDEVLQDHLKILRPLEPVPEETTNGSTSRASANSVPNLQPVYYKTTAKRAATASGVPKPWRGK